MSLLDDSSLELVEIKLYYKIVETENGKKLVVIDDEKAKELIEEGNKSIETIVTKWKMISWQEQNSITDAASKEINPQTGTKIFNMSIYRQQVVRQCLKEWNLTIDGQPAPVTVAYINKLPRDIVLNLYYKFESYSNYTEEELKN